MRLVTYLPRGTPAVGSSFDLRASGRLGGLVQVDDDQSVLDLPRAAALRGRRLPTRMLELIEAGPDAWRLASDLLDEAAADGAVAGRELPRSAPDELGAPADRVRLLAPLPDPPSLRDFFVFEEHVAAGFARRGEPIPQPWYELPVYYLTNHRAILGPDEQIPWPSFTRELDYELELAMVVGRGGRRISPDAAAAHVFGYTLYNDCSARDLQRREMQVRLGPARSKGFAQVLGPCLVTPDEVDVSRLPVTATIDGTVVTDTTTAGMRFSFADMLSYVSEGEEVRAGDVYGSGTVPGGCGLEHGRMLAPGEQITLSAPGIGALRNRVGLPG